AVAAAQLLVLGDEAVVDVGAVGAAEILDHHEAALVLQPRVGARDRQHLGEADLGGGRAADLDHRARAQPEARAQRAVLGVGDEDDVGLDLAGAGDAALLRGGGLPRLRVPRLAQLGEVDAVGARLVHTGALGAVRVLFRRPGSIRHRWFSEVGADVNTAYGSGPTVQALRGQ